MIKWNIWGRIKNAGNPWHGPIVDGVLTLPNGATKTVVGSVQPSAETWYVKFNGLPVPETSDKETLQGAHWYNDAILFGDEMRYSPMSQLGFASSGTKWLFRTPNGTIRRMQVQVELVSPPANPYDILVGESLTVRITVSASGTQILQQDDTVSNLAANYTGFAAVSLHYALPISAKCVSGSPDGSSGFLNFMVFPTRNAGAGDDTLFFARYCAAKVWRIDVEETTPGTTTASLSVFHTESECLQFDAEDSGGGTYHEVKRALIGSHWTPSGQAVDIEYRYEDTFTTGQWTAHNTQLIRDGSTVFSYDMPLPLQPGDTYVYLAPRDDYGTSGIESDARMSMHNTVVLYLQRQLQSSFQWEDSVIAVAPSGSVIQTGWMLKYPGNDNNVPPYRWRVSWNPRTGQWLVFGRAGYIAGPLIAFNPGGAGWV